MDVPPDRAVDPAHTPAARRVVLGDLHGHGYRAAADVPGDLDPGADAERALLDLAGRDGAELPLRQMRRFDDICVYIFRASVDVNDFLDCRHFDPLQSDYM